MFAHICFISMTNLSWQSVLNIRSALSRGVQNLSPWAPFHVEPTRILR